MAPEYGATMGFFPVDDVTVDYLKSTGRTADEIDAFQSYFKAQALYGVPMEGDCNYSTTLALDLDTIKPSLAGPKRPQDRIELGNMKSQFTSLFSKPVAENGFAKSADDLGKRFPTKDGIEIGSGDVLIAAITSCTQYIEPWCVDCGGIAR
jgi:aconitate hydratase